MTKLLVISGPTATGKTALAATLAKKFNGELLSADSRQVYRGMNLTTGKDRPDVPIWLYDVVEPDEDFSVSHWVQRARDAIKDITRRKKLPIVVGGTGLYIHALLHPFDTIDVPPNKTLREKLQTLSVQKLQKLVARGSMNDSDWNNPRRLMRKIELAGAKKTTHVVKNSYDALVVGLTAPISVLNKRIDERLKERTRQGLESEAATLLATYKHDLPSMSAIGLNEHAYAKRQLTWLKKQKDILWFDITKKGFEDKIVSVVRTWYT